MIKWRFDKPTEEREYLCWCKTESGGVYYPMIINWYAYGWNAIEPNSENEINNVVAWAEIPDFRPWSPNDDTLPLYSQSDGD